MAVLLRRRWTVLELPLILLIQRAIYNEREDYRIKQIHVSIHIIQVGRGGGSSHRVQNPNPPIIMLYNLHHGAKGSAPP